MDRILQGWNGLGYTAKCGWIMVPTTLALANLYAIAPTYGMALRLFTVGLYLLIFAYTLCIFFNPNNDKLDKLMFGGLVAAEFVEIMIYISCKVYLDPFTGEWETLQEVWGAGVAKASCTRTMGLMPRWLPVGTFLLYYSYLGWTIFVRKVPHNGNPNT